MHWQRPLILCLAVLAACAASPPAREPATTTPAAAPAPRVIEKAPEDPSVALVPRTGAGDLVVAEVAGAQVRRSDIGEFVIRYFRDQANEALTQLVDERIITLEAERLGIAPPPGALEKAVDAEIEKRERTIRVQFGADFGLERYLLDRYGVTLEEHRNDLARLVRIRLLRDRVIRYSQIAQDRVEAMDTVFGDLETATRVSSAATRGADLSKLSTDEGVRPGLVRPAMPRSGYSPPELAEVVFGLAEGEVSAPVPVVEGDKTLYRVFKVIRRIPAREVTWPEVRAEVEAGLTERGVEKYEYLQWAREMRDRYRVEILR